MQSSELIDALQATKSAATTEDLVAELATAVTMTALNFSRTNPELFSGKTKTIASLVFGNLKIKYAELREIFKLIISP